MNITLIGAGNLATHLGKALVNAGNVVDVVYSRTMASASRLASLLGCESTDDLSAIGSDSDLYIVSISDAAMSAVVPKVCDGRSDSIFVHTAGSILADIFKPYAQRYGVIYPMQTFSRGKDLDFMKIPCFVEASDEATYVCLRSLCEGISENVVPLSSEDRKYLHLAAVYASNFVNHCYNMAAQIVESHGIPFGLLYPLIDEVASKVHSLKPSQAQTGPAVRGDRNVIDKHLALLADAPELRRVYEIMSEGIYEMNKKL